MRLYHVTSKRKASSINRSGLDPAHATGKRQAVWLVAASRIPWALAHTAAKPGRGNVRNLIVYTVQVPRRKLTRYARGIWYTPEIVRPDCWQPSAHWTDTP